MNKRNIILSIESTGVNPNHRLALIRAVDNLNKQNDLKNNSNPIRIKIIVGTKNIIQVFPKLFYDDTKFVFYFTGFGRVFTDYSFLGRFFFNMMLWVLRYFKNLLYFICENCDDVNHVKRISQRTVYLVNGSGFEKFPTIQKKISNNKKVYLGYMSRFGRSKCTNEILKIASNLPHGWHLIVAGKDIQGKKYSNQFLKIAKEFKNVEMLGYLDNSSSKISFFKSIDIFLYPSKREGLPLSLLEGICLRIPFITTNVPGCSQLAEVFKCPILPCERFALDIQKAVGQISNFNLNYDKTDLIDYDIHTIQSQFEKILSNYHED